MKTTKTEAAQFKMLVIQMAVFLFFFMILFALTGKAGAGTDCGWKQVDYNPSPSEILTREETIAQMDQAFQASLGGFEACQDENFASVQDSESSQSEISGTEIPQTIEEQMKAEDGITEIESTAVSSISGTETPEPEEPVAAAPIPPVSPQGNTGNLSNGNGAIPQNVPDGDNDTLLESQIRARRRSRAGSRDPGPAVEGIPQIPRPPGCRCRSPDSHHRRHPDGNALMKTIENQDIMDMPANGSFQILDSGDLFDTGACCLLNPVNCVGVSGKGLALEFARRFPDNDIFYKEECRSGKLHPGKICVFWNGLEEKTPWIVNFPTKDHWRNPSRLEYIRDGLASLRMFLDRRRKNRHLDSIALPALGCGLGGLNPNDVVPLVRETLRGAPGISWVKMFLPR